MQDKVPVVVEPGAKERDCYINVRNGIEREGGRMQLGWAVWQLSNLLIEGEPHAVFDPDNGHAWVDCTPHQFPCKEILFIPDDKSSYDFNATEVRDNVRVALLDDSRVSEAIRLFSMATSLMNSVPGIDVRLPPQVALKVARLQLQASTLLSECAIEPHEWLVRTRQRIGRNDPYPCGSGKKYKKCHGKT